MNREKGQGERRIEEYGAEAEGKKNGQREREKREGKERDLCGI